MGHSVSSGCISQLDRTHLRWSSECGPQTSGISIALGLVRIAVSIPISALLSQTLTLGPIQLYFNKPSTWSKSHFYNSVVLSFSCSVESITKYLNSFSLGNNKAKLFKHNAVSLNLRIQKDEILDTFPHIQSIAFLILGKTNILLSFILSPHFQILSALLVFFFLRICN